MPVKPSSRLSAMSAFTFSASEPYTALGRQQCLVNNLSKGPCVTVERHGIEPTTSRSLLQRIPPLRHTRCWAHRRKLRPDFATKIRNATLVCTSVGHQLDATNFGRFEQRTGCSNCTQRCALAGSIDQWLEMGRFTLSRSIIQRSPYTSLQNIDRFG